MVLSDYFWKTVRKYIYSNSTVAEFYHGEKDDILRGLSKIVQDGFVYGVDELNPFSNHPNMKNLSTLPNIKLIKSRIPSLSSEIRDLDSVVIREFLWTYPSPLTGRENPEVYKAIDNSLKSGGNLFIHLGDIERKSYTNFYNGTILRNMSNFSKVFDNEDLLIYRKDSELDNLI